MINKSVLYCSVLYWYLHKYGYCTCKWVLKKAEGLHGATSEMAGHEYDKKLTARASMSNKCGRMVGMHVIRQLACVRKYYITDGTFLSS